MGLLSCAGEHLKGKDDTLVKTKPLLEMVQSSWKAFLSTDVSEQETVVLKNHDRTGWPLGKNAFIEELEFLLGRQLKRQRPGPKKKDK